MQEQETAARYSVQVMVLLGRRWRIQQKQILDLWRFLLFKMKSLATDILSAFTVFGGGKPRVLIEIVTTGGTEYYSDQYLMVGTQQYLGRILQFGRMNMETAIGEDFVREGKIPIKLSNHSPKISDDISPGDAVSIYLWDVSAAAGSKFKIFKGTVNDDIISGFYEFSFTCTDVSAKYNKLIGDKLLTTAEDSATVTYPSADPNDVGKIQPIPYGPNKNSRCLAIEAGAASTLSADHTDSQTTFNLTDTSRFPSSGQAVVGAEVISYTGKTATTLTGVTRGESAGGPATTHSQGDGIFENVATVKYMASGRIAKAVTNAKIVPWGEPVEEAVSVDDFATYVVDDSGIATIELDSLPLIRREVFVEVTQQPGVNQQPVTNIDDSPTHQHIDTNIDIAVFMDTWSLISSSGSFTYADDNEFIDKLLTTAARWTKTGLISNGATYSFKPQATLPVGIGGVPVNVRMGIRYNFISKTGIDNVDAKLYINNVLKETIALSTGGLKTEYTSTYAITAWTDITNANTRAQIEIIAGTAGWLDIILVEVWYEVNYDANPNETLPTGLFTNTDIAGTAGTEVIVSGDSVAATLGGYLICDIDGEPDIGGHWTGSGTDLIEKPVDIIHHILETFTNGPVAHANIDLAGSFADAENNHPLLDKFGFVITQQIWMNDLLTLLAQQFFSRFIWEAGIAKLNRIKISAPSINDKLIDTDWDSIKRNGRFAVKENRWGKDRVWNEISVNYNLDLVLADGKWSNPDTYLQNTQDEDATSISNNGRQTRVFNAFAIGDNTTMADDLRDKLLVFYKDNRKYIIIPSWTTLIELERGDEIDITSEQLGLSAFDCEIVNIDIEFPRKGQSLIPIITALEI